MANDELNRGLDRLAIHEDLKRTLLPLLLDAVAVSGATSGAACIRTAVHRLEVAAFVVNSEPATPPVDRVAALLAMPAEAVVALSETVGAAPRNEVWPRDALPAHVVLANAGDESTLCVWLFPFARHEEVTGFFELAARGQLDSRAREAIVALAQQAALAIEESRAAFGASTTESAALQRAAKLTEANAALKRSLDVLASQPSIDRFLAHILTEIGGRLSAHSIVLWLAEGEQSQAVGWRLCWSGARSGAGSVREILGAPAADALVKGAGRFSQLRLPLLRPLKACTYLTDDEVGALEQVGIRSILHLPLILGECVLGAFSVLFDREVAIAAEDVNLVQAFAHQATLAIRLSQLSNEAQSAAITRERARMAREIHDTLVQTFIAIIRTLKQHGGGSPDLDTARSLAERGLAESRRAVAAMRPSLLDGRPFVDALTDMASSLSQDRLKVTMTTSGTPMQLMPESEGNLFRIVQEAVNNAVNHAEATELAIDVSFLPGELSILVSDNGKGFDAGTDREQGFGLFSMRQRARAIGADLTIATEPGHGTQVYVSWRATAPPQDGVDPRTR